MKLTVAKKMALLAGSALIGIVLLIIQNQWQMRKVYDAASYGTRKTVPSLIMLDELRKDVLKTRLEVNRHINAEPTQKAAIAASVKEYSVAMREAFKKYEALVSDDKDREFLAQEKALWVEGCV